MQRNGEKLDYEHWYEQGTKLLETSHEGNVGILWNQKLQNDRTIRNIKSNFISEN